MHQERDPNADQVEHQHRTGEDTHRQHVRGGRNNRRDDEDDEDRVAQVLPKKLGAYDAEEREKHDQDRQLKRDAQPQDYGVEEVGVFADLDEGLELLRIIEEEAQRARKYV